MTADTPAGAIMKKRICSRSRLARAVLQLMLDEALSSGTEPPEAFGFLTPREAPQGKEPEASRTILCAAPPWLFYEPELLLQAFCAGPGALLSLLRAVCLDAWTAECANRVRPGGGAYGKGRRTGGDKGESLLAPVQPGRIDYRKFLERFCIPGEEAVTDPASFDYIPYLYGMEHCQKLMLLEPLEYREVNRLDELAIAIDTSGSCTDELVRRFLKETWGILSQKENFFSRMRLHLIQCDSMIEDYRIFTSLKEWENALSGYRISGRGGTDFRPVFDLLTGKLCTREIRSLRALLYFTDGDGIYPRTAPPFETAFVFLNGETEKGTPPDWAIRLNLKLPPLINLSCPILQKGTFVS